MSISLKVEIFATGAVKTMRFTQMMSVGEAALVIHEKTGEGGADHGLFQPPEAGVRFGRWLSPDRTLQFYDLKSGVRTVQ